VRPKRKVLELEVPGTRRTVRLKIGEAALSREPDAEHLTVKELRGWVARHRLLRAQRRRVAGHLVGACEHCLDRLRRVRPPRQPQPTSDPILHALRLALPGQPLPTPAARWAVAQLHEGHPLAFPRLALSEAASVDLLEEAERKVLDVVEELAAVGPARLDAAELNDLWELCAIHRAEAIGRVDPERGRQALGRIESLFPLGDVEPDEPEFRAARLEVEARLGFGPRRTLRCYRAAAEILSTRPELAERRVEVLCHLGIFLHRRRLHHRAIEVLQPTLEEAHRLDPQGRYFVLLARHHLAHAEGDRAMLDPDPEPGFRRAREHLRAAAELYDQEVPDTNLDADRWLLQARIEHTVDPAQAEHAYRRAVEILRHLPRHEPVLEARLALLTVLRAQDREAEELEAQIFHTFNGSSWAALGRLGHLLSKVAEDPAFEDTPAAEIARQQIEALEALTKAWEHPP